MDHIKDIDARSITTIRMLAVDAVEKAKSGHPGLPMGAATLAYTLFTRHLRHNPGNPSWHNRDRFVLSAGHGSMVLYALLHLTGYKVTLDDLKQFRQWGSITPGHPEHGLTPGVEVTTGPLGQGFATGVGMALAERFLKERYNREGYDVVGYNIYGIVSDGDMMEGVSAEAASYAGKLPLGNLTYVYLNNGITIEGSTDLTFGEDVGKRFEAYGWHVAHVEDGNDMKAIDAAFEAARHDPRPSLIIANTHIGYGSPTKQDTASAHGAPLGPEEVVRTKENLGWPLEPTFHVPSEVYEHFAGVRTRGVEMEGEWREKWDAYAGAFPELAREYEARMRGEIGEAWSEGLPSWGAGDGALATREASGEVMQHLAQRIPLFLGGSADLGPSNNTILNAFGHVTTKVFEAGARNLHFGIREHAMGAITNGLALSRAIVPYCATFFIFSDYMRPAMRMAALMKLHVVYVFTHDSIGQGEDGATHQPVEHLASFRAMPNMTVIRPADAMETVHAWRQAIMRRDGPTALILTRQKVPILDRTRYASAEGLAQGAYVVNPEVHNPEAIIIATGSEVSLALAASEALQAEGKRVRVVSMPSWELFEVQDSIYKESVLPATVSARVVVEAASRFGWERYVGAHGAYLTMDTYGASAPGEVLMREFGFTKERLVTLVRMQIDGV